MRWRLLIRGSLRRLSSSMEGAIRESLYDVRTAILELTPALGKRLSRRSVTC